MNLADACQAKMDTATAMIDGLAGERVRWTQQLAMFKSEIERLVGDALILTGFLSYCGPFNQEFRLLLQSSWFKLMQTRKIPFSENISVVDSLTDTATVIFTQRYIKINLQYYLMNVNYFWQTGEWNIQGLPNDELSIQNGIIVTKATRYSLLIDPQLQGKTWIKNREKNFDLQVFKYFYLN